MQSHAFCGYFKARGETGLLLLCPCLPQGAEGELEGRQCDAGELEGCLFAIALGRCVFRSVFSFLPCWAVRVEAVRSGERRRRPHGSGVRGEGRAVSARQARPRQWREATPPARATPPGAPD